jgi:3-hydroxybutyryl-CoA dehydratase
MPQKLSFEKIGLGYKLPAYVKKVTQDKINENAVGSLDFNPIHIDPEWAQKINLLGKGTTIAHGMMTMSFLASQISRWCYGSGWQIKKMESKFLKPVRPGDEISCYAEVTAIHPIGQRKDFMEIESRAENQAKEVVAVMKSEVECL